MSATPETTAAPVVDQFPNKVFVGNLSFKTTDGQLKDFFSDVGEVKEARIITRGPRSLGYGFVSFADEDTVNKAVAAKNQQELDERTINVESARPMTKASQEERTAKPAQRRQPRRSGERKEPKARVDAVVEAVKPEAQEGSSRRNAPRRQRRFPKREKPADTAEANANTKPSETVVFVGNLPFSTTDEELSKLFADFSISSAHVVIAQRTGRGKGYGFVTFSNNGEQTNAISKFVAEPIVVNERVLTISPAVNETPTAAATDAATSTAPATATESAPETQASA
ncbi:hypothetical protein BX661DRAFT_185007 [Kickxella alabastrina]|uniref:uncharacterized protein n=1 Tax=Kickxella alabastrina TaxID=61397 RepID=UPI0022201131|nr:uncharacterized protein BX661DRAFT_185007 [Kickxella alabastrina]KAI7824949.1 hypothetical protein BX661DRAFT_185007 [Kickxella alabastrina]